MKLTKYLIIFPSNVVILPSAAMMMICRMMPGQAELLSAVAEMSQYLFKHFSLPGITPARENSQHDDGHCDDEGGDDDRGCDDAGGRKYTESSFTIHWFAFVTYLTVLSDLDDIFCIGSNFYTP